MKKLMLLAAVAVFSFTNVNAQGELRAGLHGGIPMGDAGDFYTFTFGLDVTYLWEVSEDFGVGISTGYSTSAGDDISTPDISFGGITIPGESIEIDSFDYIPLAAAGRYAAGEKFVLGLDLGYGIVLTDGADGGLYYRPMVGYNVTEDFQTTISYRGVSSDADFNALTLGVSYKLL